MEEIWLSPMTKKTLHPQKNPESNVATQKRHQNFDYTTISDRLRTISWSNNSNPTGVVKPVLRAPDLPTNCNSCVNNGSPILIVFERENQICRNINRVYF